MKTLKFNSQLLAYDLSTVLIQSANEIMEHFKSDAETRLKATDFETKDAIYDAALQMIHAECIFYGWSILESYGTGSKMDRENEWLDTYMYNESLGWNPLRYDETIVGRKKGYYINFFGERAYSKGEVAGVPFGFMGKDTGKKPTKAIQQAEQILKEGRYVNDILTMNVEDFFQNLNSSKYFTFS